MTETSKIRIRISNKLRWGILGCANIAVEAVMPAIAASELNVLEAVASRDVAKGRAVAERFGIAKAYGSYEELLRDPDIDAVYIPLPNHLHKEWTIKAAEAGKHVLCEKPIALNAREAEEMAEACARAGVVLAEAFMYRHHPRIDTILGLVRGGEIGELRAIRGSFTFNNAEDHANIRLRPEWGGGSLYDVGVYPLTAARLITGSEPEAVTVHALFSPEHGNVDMMASGLVEFAGGVSLAFDCGMWADYRNTLEIVGTKGRIEVPESFKPEPGTPDCIVYANGQRRVIEPSPVNQYSLQADDFARAVFGETPQRFAPDDAVKNMRLVEACLLSARERRRVTLGNQ
ncbi:Gfo/Idh/MocA family oxidoreductase [Cohnella xylanilytica]|uniref:Gfo/Idh/MocA family oxidoreductase n=1 Tax=Cohnella xylanilytica TaxID=557555 RepID=A0A841TWZ4_9BACL|nr:Gfo/Idh/MocA family oxidoreductase [Cohnella xylanilytica]MBB6691518.1 Gfo/Idh/MocA family oxidoreductase [Cohnella xylanilytica]